MVAIPGSSKNISNLDIMRVTGGFLTAFSAISMALVVFVLPGYSILVAFEVLILFTLLITGMVILIAGEVTRWRRNRAAAKE